MFVLPDYDLLQDIRWLSTVYSVYLQLFEITGTIYKVVSNILHNLHNNLLKCAVLQIILINVVFVKCLLQKYCICAYVPPPGGCAFLQDEPTNICFVLSSLTNSIASVSTTTN